MSIQKKLGFNEGAVVALPFFENEKFVVGVTRSGGMGSVFQLLPLLPSQPALALKTCQESIDLTQFNREARIWISLGSHPNIAEAIAFGTIDNTPCILALWYPKNMSDLNPTQMKLHEVCNFVAGIIAGLNVGYEKLGLIHKDIKPMNILVDENTLPKIADFGISSYVPYKDLFCNSYSLNSNIAVDGHEPAGGISGTPLYMAPELYCGGINSIQTDIFALGITLFQWLTGKHPYFSNNGSWDDSCLKTFPDFMRQTYGNEITPLTNLVMESIQLDSIVRPENYHALLNKSGFKKWMPKSNFSASKNDILTVVSRAQVFRQQGRVDEAVLLLKQNIDYHPSEPLLLNAYSTLLIKLGKPNDAIPFIKRSIQLLEKNNGLYNGKPFFEPHLNLALLYLGSEHFELAAGILRKVVESLGSSNESLTLLFWEFGWLKLYEGKVDDAIQRFIYYLSRKNVIEPVVGMFCLAAHITNNSQEYYRKCFDLISAIGCNDVTVCQYLCVMGSSLDPARLHRLNTKVLSTEMIASLEKLSLSISGNTDYFKMPMTKEMIKRVLSRVDSKYTGGKYLGLL